jgi:hypothetical protein
MDITKFIDQIKGFLDYGIPGLCAIAIILSFLLLYREGNRASPRTEMLRTIRLFMRATLVLGVVSGAALIFGGREATSQPSVAPKMKRQNPSNALTTRPKAKPQALSPETDDAWEVEIFYVPDGQQISRGIANALADALDGKYNVRLTELSTEKRNKWKIRHSQIRHEGSETSMAQTLRSEAERILRSDGVSFEMKQITSNSPNYISLFIYER